MAKQKLNAQLGLDTKQYDKGLQNAAKGAENFGQTLNDLGKTIGLVYAVNVLKNFSVETVKLAARAEGIKVAFDKIDDPRLLQRLRDATKNTVADVDLMSSAVRANNFQISLKALPKYFEFAAARAQATGESVDYLVESLVMGIGRKSAMILDNLGISITAINDELKKTPNYAIAVGNIIDREMKKAGGSALTASGQIAQFATAWSNFKEGVGKWFLDKGVGNQLAAWGEVMALEADQTIESSQKHELKTKILKGEMGAYYKLKTAMDSFFESMDEANVDRYIETYSKRTDAQAQYMLSLAQLRKKEIQAQANSSETKQEEIETLTTLNQKLSDYETQLASIPITNKALIQSTLRTIEALKEQINTLLTLPKSAKGIKIDTSAGVAALPQISKATDSESITQPLNDGTAWLKLMDDQAAQTTETLGAVGNAFNTIGNSIDGAAGSWIAYIGNVLSTIPQVIEALAALTIAEQAKATASGTAAAAGAASSVASIPIAGPILAIGAIAAVMAALLSMPKLAGGGLAYGPTSAIIGEYPGASSNPEVISPLSKLKDAMGDTGGTVHLTAKLKGRDIYLSGTRYSNSLNKNS